MFPCLGVARLQPSFFVFLPITVSGKFLIGYLNRLSKTNKAKVWKSGKPVLRIEPTGQSFRISRLQCLHSAANCDNNYITYCLYIYIIHEYALWYAFLAFASPASCLVMPYFLRPVE